MNMIGKIVIRELAQLFACSGLIPDNPQNGSTALDMCKGDEIRAQIQARIGRRGAKLKYDMCGCFI